MKIHEFFYPTIHRVLSFYINNMIFLERRNFMKKIFINYYAVIIFILYLIDNTLLYKLKVSGPLYIILLDLFLISNIVLLSIKRKEIKFKTIIIIAFILTIGLSKNLYQLLYVNINVITLLIIGFKESKFIRIIFVLLIVFLIKFSSIIFYILLFASGDNGEFGPTNKNLIYEDTHYYCNSGYETYAFSAGAMDNYHYYIGKNYKLLNIDGIINVIYKGGNIVSKEEYIKYNRNELNNCKTKGVKYGFKKNS